MQKLMNEKIIPKIMAFINLKGIQAIKDGMVYSMPLLIVCLKRQASKQCLSRRTARHSISAP